MFDRVFQHARRLAANFRRPAVLHRRPAVLGRRLILRLARSRRLDRAARAVPAVLMLVGLYLVLLGGAASLGGFNAGMTRLVDLVGADGVAAGAAGFFQRQVVSLFGYVPPVMAQSGPPPAAAPTLAIPADPGLGFVPYRVAVGSAAHAPALARRAVEGPTGPGESAPIPGAPTQAVVAAFPTRTPTPKPTREPAAPDRISIPAIGLDAPVVVSPRLMVQVGDQAYAQWDAPGYFAAGWQEGSARLGEAGNTVINGHHNIDGEVFGRLRDLSQGDTLDVYAGERVFHYVVAQVMKLEERDMPLAQRLENAQWIMPSDDERLTLVTCWPPVSNTYRLIVVAVPTGE